MFNHQWLDRTKLTQSSSSQNFGSLTQLELDTMSDSVKLDDIIQDYDGASKKSNSVSLASLFNAQLSQSFFSAFGSKGDETTSFYSALQDGFSLNQYEHFVSSNSPNFNPAGENSCLQVDEDISNEKETMLKQSHFQVSWHSLTYKIKPKITFSGLAAELDQKIRSKFSLALQLVTSRSKTQSTYNISDETVTILRKVSGSFRSGELTAVMGPSGAGKTTLLNFLSRRREDGYTGCLQIDSLRHVKISTIPQHDKLPEYLTVKENLMFASRLNNPESGFNHLESIERVWGLLGLEKCLNTRTKKISGGQQKRLAIAQELLSRPDILILDEPTSGLDSLTCLKTLTVLKNLVIASKQNLIDPIAIVLTIHQPQHDVFNIFDKIYVLANHGIAIYDGPPGHCSQFISRKAGIEMPDEDYNPASFAIEIASGEYGKEVIEILAKQTERSTTSEFVTFSDKTRNKQNNDSNSSLFIDEKIGRGSKKTPGGFYQKTCVLAERYWMSIIRDPKQLLIRLLFPIILPVALAVLVGTDPGKARACPHFKGQYDLKDLVRSDTITSSDVQEELSLTLENLGVLFIIVYAISCSNIAAITLSFTLDMQSSLKEHYNGWYSMSTYLIARILADIPLAIFLPVLCITLGYYLTGQNIGYGLASGFRITIMATSVILGALVGQTLGMIVGAIYLGHVSTALFASQGITLPLVFLSGFVVRTKNMSRLVYALSQMSFYKHMLEITVISKYGFNICQCNQQEITGKDAELTGVPEELRSFTKNWITSFTTIDQTNSSSVITDPDIFQLFAKQISLYNTYGMTVRSCEDVVPYQLQDLSISEKNLPASFLALTGSLLMVQLLLFITVKLVVKLRTSL